MIDNSGGVGKQNDFTYFNLFRETEQVDVKDLSLQNNAGAVDKGTSETKAPAEKDSLEWKLGTNLYPTQQRDKLKLQIQDSKDRVAENRKGPTRFIGKVTYELEGHPDLGNGSAFKIDDLG